MKRTIPNVKGEVILSYQENGYQAVLDKFDQAKFINIVTYNINTYEPSTFLIKELRNVDSSTPITLILNIPARREDYINKRTGKIDPAAVKSASDKIKYTLKVLERGKFGDLNVYFNFDNHAKLIMTDTIAYIGSQNFSDASQAKFELGFLVNEPESIKDINNRIFAEIKSKSILYATSEYAVLMEEIADIMRGLLQNIREDIFTWVGDEPHYPYQEILDINNAHFKREKWEEFKDLHYRFEEIVESLINDYPSEFNKGAAEKEVNRLSDLVKRFVSELDELANFMSSMAGKMMWSKFEELDIGENMDEALEDALYHVRDYKQEKFYEIEDKGKELIKTFDDIEKCIKELETIIDEIKDAMISKSVYQNIELIENYK
ncbi:phosphatidylserine/phosphatidylglycerophosphate/cardiolipin synthase family protein [Peribacillus asahii]|uniref:phosphatidylserine/phosphatidylglycerophosphate/ cardiolipin synthase family protein n=1 Tax=Peribacillus asahii TaxID=228899 RepID=UPI002079892F|nr:phosphatidylserine/phosphatidylglycerophosphate/cardiolipin synthase family protein [Peribacillus asahii]USK62354.1 phosphatidylserine/phosphatidylglycerophosphate/cardiolipin synthase family protein [Peribacillus asahii]